MSEVAPREHPTSLTLLCGGVEAVTTINNTLKCLNLWVALETRRQTVHR